MAYVQVVIQSAAQGEVMSQLLLGYAGVQLPAVTGKGLTGAGLQKLEINIFDDTLSDC